MRTFASWINLLAAIVLIPLCATRGHAADATPTKKVLLIGIDGCRPDALAKAKAPNLNALADGGASSFTAQILPLRIVDAETSSGPGWTSMLSGAWPDKHGWIDDVRRRRFNGQYPHFFGRLKTFNPKLNTVSIITWPEIQRMTTGADVNEVAKGDNAAVERGIEVLTKQNPDVVFIHLDDVDGAGHAKGFNPELPEYIKAIEETDARVGRIVEAVKKRPTYAQEDWLILVSSDHGGWGTGHNSHRNVVPEIRKVFFIANGPAAEKGTIAGQVYTVDVAATALAHMGVKLDPAWKLDGVPAGLKGFPTPAVSRPNEPAATVLIRAKK
ncbi:MAG: alkaline phosphatase family protein [Planctomycetia bacterium]|nr:alkaline phosphatase family protein [Planctomycetia bacterium]